MGNSGYNTAARKKISEYLKTNRSRAVNVNDIYDYLHEIGHDVNITTVYRYLDKLTDDGTVMKYNSENGSKAVYQFVEPEHHCNEHLHLKCIRCGTIIHLDCEFMREISEHIKDEHGFSIQCKNSIIYGICEKCGKLPDTNRN